MRYENTYLSPPTASVPVKGNVVLTPYARTVYRDTVTDDCGPGPESELCILIPRPVLQEARAVPLLNTKAGYRREWLVEDTVGGTPALGTVVAPPGGSGAFYVAPARTPTPNPVRVTFRSRHEASGRTLALHARVEVREPYWTGTAQGLLGTADLGFLFTADAIWSMAADGAAGDYTAAGSQLLTVINVRCTASPSPSTAALPPGALKIDDSTSPATYTLDVGSLWDTVITGTCPGGSGSAPMTVPGRLQVAGTVSADGRRIEGSARLNNIDWTWSLRRQD